MNAYKKLLRRTSLGVALDAHYVLCDQKNGFDAPTAYARGSEHTHHGPGRGEAHGYVRLVHVVPPLDQPPLLDGRVLLRARRARCALELAWDGAERAVRPGSSPRARRFVAVNSNASMPFRRFSAFLNTASGGSAPKMLVETSRSPPSSPARGAQSEGVRLGLTVRHRAGLVAAEHGVRGEELEELADVERAHLGLRHLVDGGRDEAHQRHGERAHRAPALPVRFAAMASGNPRGHRQPGRVAGSLTLAVQGHAPVAAPVRQSLDPRRARARRAHHPGHR